MCSPPLPPSPARLSQSEGQNRSNRPKYPADSRTDCWFCLASPDCETHLIASCGEHVYVALPKGGLTPYHALLVPINHASGQFTLDPAVAQELARYKSGLTHFFGYRSSPLKHLSPPPLSTLPHVHRSCSLSRSPSVPIDMTLHPLNSLPIAAYSLLLAAYSLRLTAYWLGLASCWLCLAGG